MQRGRDSQRGVLNSFAFYEGRGILPVEREGEHHQMTMEPKATLTINRFPTHASSDLQRAIQHYYDMVAVSLRLAETGALTELILPGSYLQCDFVANEKRSFDHVRLEILNWIMRTGIRDCLEAISLFLEDIRHQCALFRLAQSKSGSVLSFDLRSLEADQQRFHMMRLPDKLKTLKKQFAIQASPDMESSILSINKARNCLVHRGGRVRHEDIVDGASALSVCWYKFALMAVCSEGSRPLQMPKARVNAGEDVAMQMVKVMKQFALGAPVVFTAQEFSEICSTYHFFGVDIARASDAYLRAQGYKFADDVTQPSGLLPVEVTNMGSTQST